MKEKIKPIVIKDSEGNTKYVLEFSRATAEFAEAQGLIISEVEQKPLSTMDKLFFFAFRKNHPRVTKAEADKVLEDVGGMSDQLLVRLVELYTETANSLLATEESLKNAKMTVTF